MISIICPYIIPVALSAAIVKAAISAYQTEMGRAAIIATKSFIANLGDKLVETVVSVAQYFGVGPTVAGFVQTDVEKVRAVGEVTIEQAGIEQMTPAIFQKMPEVEQQNFIREEWEASLQRAKERAPKIMASNKKNRIEQAEALQASISVAEISQKKYMTFQIFAKTAEDGHLLLLNSQDTGCFYPFKHNGPASIRLVTRDIPEWNLIEGDYIYFDLKHCDHIEVFHLDNTRSEIFPGKKLLQELL